MLHLVSLYQRTIILMDPRNITATIITIQHLINTTITNVVNHLIGTIVIIDHLIHLKDHTLELQDQEVVDVNALVAFVIIVMLGKLKSKF